MGGAARTLSGPDRGGNFIGDRAIRGLAEQTNKITHWSQYPSGGHFAPLQAPDDLVADIRAFFKGLRTGR